MQCDDDGSSCHIEKDHGFLATLVESFTAGTPFSAFLLAGEICFVITLFASIPNTRKDSVFCFLATIFAPFLVKTSVEVAYFISIYFYTSSYTFWSWIHDSVVSFCYSSFLFNFQYGMVLYSWQSIIVAVKKRPVTKSYTRWPYILLFFITLIQAALFWQIMILGFISMLLILVLAPLTITVTIFCAFCCKSNPTSEHEAVRNAKCIMLWNIPGLLLTMSDVAGQIYLTAYSNSNAIHHKEYLFSILYPAATVLIMFITLPALRKAIFPCCFTTDNDNSDRMFFVTRDSISQGSVGSPTPSDQSNISTISNPPIVTYPNNSVVPYNPVTPLYPYFPMPNMYPQAYPQDFQHQYQPLFVPVPMTFYNQSQFPMRQNEIPVVQ
ncbi:Serpentine Receptor, class T [Caenorhabditis elegans]|uniref:Serpentine Receptor, class T n=1 Tax=Caenorhabditis elegans TaxID=6239 RepID=Q20503_CAEEL|nr:Serpentine Receptor, class T [Caenorhabditis elegans]CAA91983.2 Serpentine Receptor, class T [Caenorhabditis elegans]|eukprot:NP_509819.2 Uncharacterized protein CELE_F47B10.3 [Caenorhabditis elegans]